MLAYSNSTNFYLFIKMNKKTSRKRNPYSIEELLKKPDKKRKTDEKDDIFETSKSEEISDEINLNIEVCD